TPVSVVKSRSRSVMVGAFVQDSWSILDRITLNAGVRFDAQTLYAPRDVVALRFPNQWSPRVGVVWDPTQEGRSKLDASYARYYESIPMNLADQSFGSSASVEGLYLPASGGCSPRSPVTTSCTAPDRLIPGGARIPPNPTWFVGAADRRAAVDPTIKPP